MSGRALVTAGAAGIGRVIAEALADDGWRVAVCDLDAGALADLAAARPDIDAARVDVADEAAHDAWVDAAIGRLGGLDLAIGCAGIAGPIGAVETLDLEGWRRCLAIGLDAQFLLARKAAPIFKAQRSGVLLMLSSNSGLYGVPFRSPYVASKWAIVGLAKALSVELGPFGARVNAICPGAVAGARIERVIAAEALASGRPEAEIRAEWTSATSMRRFVEPREIADLVRYLASPAAAMITGQAIAIDGGTETFHIG